jgi:hypothetical protein
VKAVRAFDANVVIVSLAIAAAGSGEQGVGSFLSDTDAPAEPPWRSSTPPTGSWEQVLHAVVSGPLPQTPSPLTPHPSQFVRARRLPLDAAGPRRYNSIHPKAILSVWHGCR